MTTKISEANIQATTLGALGGGGPKITSIIVTDSSYNNLDDTAVDLGGGYIKLIGEDFATGCQVLIGLTPVTSVTFISDTEVRAQVPATAAGTYIVYLVNTDGGTAIRVNAITFSSTPTWVTGSTLSGISDTAISVQLAATGASTFSLQAGSSLPTGLSLSSSGLLSGSVTVVNETVYNFTVNAIDAELQDSPRTFSITISYGDLYFMYNTLVLPGASTSFIKDSSTNNLTVTVSGDTKPNGFSPYPPGYYSVYFDGTSNSNVGTFTGPTIGVDDYTVEFWVYLKAKSTDQDFYEIYSGSSLNLLLELDGATNKIRHNLRNDAGTSNFDFNSTSGITSNTWYHLAFVVSGATAYTFINGNCTTLGATASITGERTATFTGNLIGSLYSGTRRLNGYMSNLRMVKGTAIYTSNFTPPTSPLTAVDGTALLMLQSNRFVDNSTSNHSITSIGSSNLIKSFQPFTLSSSYSTYGSAYFDGSEDYLNIAASSALAYGTGDFEISFWYYPISASGYLFDQRTAQPQQALTMYYDSGSINVYINGAIPISGTEPRKNAWHYLTLSRVSGSTRLFVDGAQIGSTAADSNNYGTLPLRIGCRYATTTDIPYGGYMSNFRVVKGNGVSSQTVPTIPLTAIANTSLLILQNNQPVTNNVFLDSSNNEFNITRLGDTTQGSFSPYGSNWSTYFDGSGDTLTTPSTTAFNLSTNPFCIEMWFYWTGGASSGYSGLCGSASDYKIAMSIWNSKIMYGASSNGSSWNILAAESSVGANTVVANQWNHLVLCRTGNTFSGYLNGVRDITTTSASAVVSRTEAYVVGAWYSSLYYFSGYISNFRFVVGSNPYNATGTTITVPTTPLSAISDTALLTSHANRFIDGSTNNFAITNNNEARVQRFSPFRNASAYDPSIHGGSAYLDGTGDNLQIPYTALYVPSADPYSIEVWVYFTGSGTNQGVIGTTSDGFAGFERGSGNWQYYNGISASSAGVAAKLYQWNHVVICRNAAGAGAFFVNGSRLATFTDTGTKSAFGNLQIGYNGVAGGAYTSGYITDYRYVIGNPYDPTLTTLTVPTAPLTAIANTQVLCNFTGGAIVDNAMQNNLETEGDAKLNTAVTKFGGSSMYFDGSGDRLLVPSNPSFDFGTGNFTIEMWINFTNVTSTWQAVIGRAYALTGGWRLYKNDADNQMRWYAVGTSVVLTTGSTLASNTWGHVAVVRNNGTLTIYIDGVNRGSASNTTDYTPGNYALEIGEGVVTSAYPVTGYIDDLRITKGYARYTTNFTAPTTTHLLK